MSILKSLITKITLGLIAVLFFSCEKSYDCKCYSDIKKSDTLMDHVVTTSYGVKGWEKTCKNYSNTNTHLSNCRVE